MRTARLIAIIAILSLMAVLPTTAQAQSTTEADDTVVIAVVDSGFSPYNQNWRSATMPQHLDADPSNDLPLDTAPSEWLPGWEMNGNAVDAGPINLTLDDAGDAQISDLEAADKPEQQMKTSDNSTVNVHWIPGTKIVGAVTFGSTSNFFAQNNTHGNGSSAVSAGNIHGTCPECLVVLVRYGSGTTAEAASDWAYSQPWIDVVTNSFGFSTVMRDRIYDGANTELQREASERGQSIFFSAGNGQANTFTAPNTTIQSSQEGPDWIITVGGTAPNGAQYTGAGKPADMAAIGTGYPAGYGGSTTAGNSGTFGGTSNATPVSAGTYARTLYLARKAMEGASRTQDAGVIATGDFTCGTENADCPMGDGALTVDEMRFGFLQSLERTPQGLTPVGILSSNPPSLPAYAETEFAAEGHGSLFGRLNSDDNWLEEVGAAYGPLAGDALLPERTQEERDWMVVDSLCRQDVHGSWDGGYYVEGETEVPTINGPLASLIQHSCPAVFGLLKDLGTAPAAAPLVSPED